MTQPESQQIRALRTIEKSVGDRAPKDFVQNLVNLNQATKYLTQMMIITQEGVDMANRDIIAQIQDAIDELIILFAGGGESFDFDWGDMQIVVQNLAAILGIPNFTVLADVEAWAANFINDIVTNPLGAVIVNFINDMLDDLFNAIDGATGSIFDLSALAGRMENTEDTAASAFSTADNANTVSAAAAAQADAAYDQAMGVSGVAEAAQTAAENAENIAAQAQLTADAAYENAQYWTNEALVASAQINVGVNELLLGMVMDVPTGKQRKITDLHFAMLDLPGTATIETRKTTLAGVTTTIHTASFTANQTRKSYNNLNLTVADKDRVFWNVTAISAVSNVLSVAAVGVLLDA